MWYRPGDIVSVRIGPIKHEGIMTEHGRVICNSRRLGGVTEKTVRDFAQGRKIKNEGPLNGTPSELVLHRARSQMGRDYHPSGHNCEHFVRQSYGLRPHSPQKRLAIGAAALAALIAIF